MEISFFSAPEANANMGAPASAVCPRQEFSLLMAAFLKSAQPQALVEAGLPEVSVQPASGPLTSLRAAANEGMEEGGPDLKPEETPVEAVPAQLPDALASMLVSMAINRTPQEGAPVAAEVRTPATAQEGNGLGKAGLNPAPSEETDRFFPAEGNGMALMKEGGIGLQKGFEVTPEHQEYFEIDIPVEELMGREDVEPGIETAEPGMEIAEPGIEIAERRMEIAEPMKASEDLDSAPSEASASLKPSASVETENIASSDQARPEGPSVVETSSSFMREFDLGGNQEENIGQNNPPEAEVLKTTENAVPGLAFEKTIDQVSQKTDSPAARPAVAAEVHEKVQAGIKVSVENNGGEVKMKLNPESLGEVRIRLNVDSGMVRAQIIVESPEVKSIIESDSSFLRDSLGAHGLTLDKCVVEVGRSFETGQHETDERRSSYGEEHRPAREDGRGHEKGRGNWHRHFRQNQATHEGGIDFFA